MRNQELTMRQKIAFRAAMVSVVALGAGCKGSPSTGSDPDAGARLSVFVPAQDVTLAKQFNSGIIARELVVVRNASEWPATWSRIHGSQQPTPDVVQPDFATEMAVVAAMGEKPSGGFDISIDSVTHHERGSIVHVTEKTPGPGCMTTGALTQPVHAVRAPRSDGNVWWRERTMTENC